MTTIEIPDDDALVLFELLSRIDEQDDRKRTLELVLEDTAELYSLVKLHGALERTLVEPFKPDYADLVTRARSAVNRRYGGVG